MPTKLTLAMAALAAGIAVPAAAQTDDDQASREARAGRTAKSDPCANMGGTALTRCRSQQQAATKGTPGVSAADGKLFNETSVAANAKLQAKDFAGAAAIYQQAIAANPRSAVLHRLYAGQAIALRNQAVAVYNAEQPVIPPAGATNEQIRAANQSNAGLQARKTAAALPLFRQAQQAAANAAAAAQAGKDRAVDDAIAVELRQSADFLYSLDRDATLATPRASADYEAAALRKWLAANPTLAGSLVAKYGIATAATVLAKDKAAGLTLADEVVARTGGDADGAIGYADLVVAAQTSAGDPRRAKALAGLTAVEASVIDPGKKAKIARLKAALSAA